MVLICFATAFLPEVPAPSISIAAQTSCSHLAAYPTIPAREIELLIVATTAEVASLKCKAANSREYRQGAFYP
jgi:hypothetical protein